MTELPPERLSLADFVFSETSDPSVPSEEFTQWRRATAWATSLYEPSLLGPPLPRTRLETAGVSRPIINLGSYNYLGLATHPETIAAAQEALATYGTGACGSGRVVDLFHPGHLAVEVTLPDRPDHQPRHSPQHAIGEGGQARHVALGGLEVVGPQVSCFAEALSLEQVHVVGRVVRRHEERR